MILCEFTPTGGDMIRCAMSDFADVHLWKSFIMGLPSVKISMPHPWGGYASPPDFADLSFSPDMFADSWPPPENASIRLLWIEDDETQGVVVWDGTAVLAEMPYDAIKYKLARHENDSVVAESTAFADTLVNVMATLCGASYLNLSIDTTSARIPSPAVSYTTTSEQLTIDFASELCAFFAHGFYIEGGTLYLVDMYDITTEQTEVDPWEITSETSGPKYGTRYSTAKSGDYSVASATVLNGQELSVSTAYHGTQANIEAALAIILEIANRPQIELNGMIGPAPMQIGGCYLFNDENHLQPLQYLMKCSDIVYNFDSEKLLAVGAGSVA